MPLRFTVDVSERSIFQIVYQYWGIRENFQTEYGLSMSFADIRKGNAILKRIQEDLKAMDEEEKIRKESGVDQEGEQEDTREGEGEQEDTREGAQEGDQESAQVTIEEVAEEDTMEGVQRGAQERTREASTTEGSTDGLAEGVMEGVQQGVHKDVQQGMLHIQLILYSKTDVGKTVAGVIYREPP